MAQKSAGEMMKRIVRRIGHDWLPVEVLDSLKRSAAEANVADASGGISKPRKNWKPNLKLKRLFSYIHDKDIQPKVSIFSLRSVERTGGTSVYHLKTPYQESETDNDCLWKGKLDRRYVILKKGVAYLTPEEEAKIAKPRHNPKTTDLR